MNSLAIPQHLKRLLNQYSNTYICIYEYACTNMKKLTVVLKFRSIQQYHSFGFADFNEGPLMLCETL